MRIKRIYMFARVLESNEDANKVTFQIGTNIYMYILQCIFIT